MAAMSEPVFVPYRPYVPDASAEEASRRFYEVMAQRRSVRMICDRPVELTLFPDGRAIIKGTTEPLRARTIYAKYVGG